MYSKMVKIKYYIPNLQNIFQFLFPINLSIDYIILSNIFLFTELKAKIFKEKQRNFGFNNQYSKFKNFDNEKNHILCSMCKLFILHPQCDNYDGAKIHGYFYFFCREKWGMDTLLINQKLFFIFNYLTLIYNKYSIYKYY